MKTKSTSVDNQNSKRMALPSATRTVGNNRKVVSKSGRINYSSFILFKY